MSSDVQRSQRAPEGTPLYVHLPFCVVKCTYCDFFSVVGDEDQFEPALRAIVAEARARAPLHPSTVFLGGGTPSIYSADQLSWLLDELDAASNFRSSSSEVTVECNPESLDREKIERLVAGGVDRLSIGIQSLDPAVLQLFGRPHTADIGLRAYDAARSVGVPRVSLDVIYAVPGQPWERWEEDLARILERGPDHISAYHLAFEEGTQLTQRLAQGRLRRWDEDTELHFLEGTRERLEASGYPPYEISNFAPKGEECRHNINYWRNGPYVGIGPSAVSKVGQTRFGNLRSVPRWQRAVEAGESAVEWSETLSPTGRLGETWWLGLRMTQGVGAEEALERSGFGDTGHDPGLALAQELAGEGWLQQTGERWSWTRRGLALADRLSKRFLELESTDDSCGATKGSELSER